MTNRSRQPSRGWLDILNHLPSTNDTQSDNRMLSKIYHQTLCNTAAAILIALTIPLTGCATMGVDAENENSFTPDWSNALRLPSENSELSGLSETSRQIERNLGF
jgi:hypothetical protein